MPDAMHVIIPLKVAITVFRFIVELISQRNKVKNKNPYKSYHSML